MKWEIASLNLNSPQNQSIGKSFFGRMKNCKSLQKTRTYCKKMHVFKLWPKTSHFSQIYWTQYPKIFKTIKIRTRSLQQNQYNFHTMESYFNETKFIDANSLWPINTYYIWWNGPVDFSNSLFFNNSVGVFNSLRPQIIDIKMQTLEYRLHSFPTIRDV